MTKAGQLDRTIELFALGAPVDDGYGEVPGTWSSQGTRKARYMPAMAREVFENAGKEAKLPTLFEVRSDTLTRQINAKWRVRYDGADYEVLGTQELGRQDGIRLECIANDDVL